MIDQVTRFIDGEPVTREVVLRRRTPMEEREYWFLKLGQLMNELRDKDRAILALAERIFLQHELLAKRAETATGSPGEVLELYSPGRSELDRVLNAEGPGTTPSLRLGSSRLAPT